MVFSIRSIGKLATAVSLPIPDTVADASGEPGDASRELPAKLARAFRAIAIDDPTVRVDGHLFR